LLPGTQTRAPRTMALCVRATVGALLLPWLTFGAT
jgi:hypothetical protein